MKKKAWFWSKTMTNNDTLQQHIFAVLVDNEPGVLARVIGLFSGRGYNIESLTVGEVDPRRRLSRVTIATSGTQIIIDQIRAQLSRIVSVHVVRDLSVEKGCVLRDLALIKVRARGEKRVEALRTADIFRARVVDSTPRSFVFEITGGPGKIAAFIELMKPLGLIDMCRTGILAIARGDNSLEDS